MTRKETFNFSSGPSVLPAEALERAGAEICNFGSSGMSVMEMSHRSPIYEGIFAEVKTKLKKALSVPDSHEILFLQGGASMQFSMIPMNLMGEKGCADYAVTGNFSDTAYKEAKKYGTVNLAASSEDKNHTYIPAQNEITTDPNASYFYYCANNTIYGTQWKYVPETGAVPIACDMSSEILSKPVDIKKYGVIFAGAQKNMAPAGLTVVIIDKALAGRELPFTPLMMSYGLMIEKDSMFNTPPCWNIYILGLVLDWLESRGGVIGMEKETVEKAKMVYDVLDESRLFNACAEPGARSNMNITFRTKSREIDAAFVKEAEARGLLNLKGHRSVGGMRASVYNAQPIEGILALTEYMRDFEVKNRV